MAWDPTPTNYMEGWTEDGTDITVPIASFPELTAEIADSATGDIRGIVFAFVDQWYNVWIALATADRSKNMTMARGQSIQTDNTIIRTYTLTFRLDPEGFAVQDEPA